MINTNELELLLNHDSSINFSPESLEQEIAQNIQTIFATGKYSVPLDRDFGLDATIQDIPQTTLEAVLSAEIVEAIEKFEPRVKITSIKFTASPDGLVSPLIHFIIRA